MTTSRVTYTQHLRTEATHLKSGQTIYTDAPTDNHGKGEAFSPTDLCATSLANCMLTVMGIKATQMNIELEGTVADVTKIMADSPRRISEIHVKMHVKGKHFNEKEQQILTHTALTCPVSLSLHPDIKQQVEITFD